jgi:outer membrane protein TolC
MNRFARWIAQVGAFVMLLQGVRAEEPRPITLDEVRSQALQNNLTLSQARRDEQAARWKMIWAVSEVLPHVTLNSSYSRFDEESVFRQNIFRDILIEQYHINPADFPPFAYKNLYATSISVDQPIYNGGMEINGLRIAATTKRLMSYNRQALEKQTLYEAERAYYSLCRAQAALGVRQQAVEISRQYVARFQHRLELGLTTQVDVLRWELQLAGDEAALVDAQNALHLAQVNLTRLLGAETEKLFLAADLDELIAAADSVGGNCNDLDSLWSRTRYLSPDLLMMNCNLDLARHNRWTALSNFQPRINFNYSYSWQADDDPALDGFKQWVASISLSWPIFSSFGNVARYQESRINLRKAEDAQRDFEAGLFAQLTAAWSELQSAKKRWISAQKMRRQAEQVLAMQEHRSEQGLITNLELLDARNAAREAELAFINAALDLRIAEAGIQRIAGN